MFLHICSKHSAYLQPPRRLGVPSNKHGRRHKAVPAVDGGALVKVLVVGARVHVGGRDLAVGGVVPARGGGGVVVLPLSSVTLLIIVGVEVLAAQQ